LLGRNLLQENQSQGPRETYAWSPSAEKYSAVSRAKSHRIKDFWGTNSKLQKLLPSEYDLFNFANLFEESQNGYITDQRRKSLGSAKRKSSKPWEED